MWWWSWEWLGVVSESRESKSTTLRNIGLVVGGGIAIWVAYRRSVISQLGLLNERYQKGAEMLGSEVLSVRLGGIYALQRLADDEPERYHVQVTHLLCAFASHPTEDADYMAALGVTAQKPHQIREDVLAAMTAIGTRSEDKIELEKKEKFSLTLTGAYLADAYLSDVNLTGANLLKANLNGADLFKANLNGANLTDAYLTGANLLNATLLKATLVKANLLNADLTSADLSGADLSGATLTNANLTGATLTNANLTGVTLTNATLTNADLTGAVLTNAYLLHADLTGANLTGAALSGADLAGTVLVRVKGFSQDQTCLK